MFRYPEATQAPRLAWIQASWDRTWSTMQWDAIWNHARNDLLIITPQGDQDVFLWEHSSRVAENARRIARLPEVLASSPDETAIIAAALYHDAGWIARLDEGEIRRDEILVKPIPEAHLEQGALMMERCLAELLPLDSLERAARAIRTMNDRHIESIEGQVVAEANNLDEFGLFSLWCTIRRGVLDGKGVQAAIDTWRRRKEYRFWEARLKESFRFPAVREIAEKRLDSLERVMEELAVQHSSSDFPPLQEGL